MQPAATPSSATSPASNARPVAAPVLDGFGVRGDAGPKAKNTETGDGGQNRQEEKSFQHSAIRH